jgi:hypothetical protein
MIRLIARLGVGQSKPLSPACRNVDEMGTGTGEDSLYYGGLSPPFLPEPAPISCHGHDSVHRNVKSGSCSSF